VAGQTVNSLAKYTSINSWNQTDVFVTVLPIFQAVMDQETDNGIKNNYPPVLPLQGSKLYIDRITQLKDHFVAKYKQEPEFFIRVPGRYVCVDTWQL